MYKLNVGNLDRALRMLLGFALIGLAASGAIGWWGYIGIVLVIILTHTSACSQPAATRPADR